MADPSNKSTVLAHESNLAARRVDKFSRLVFPITFICFNCVFWAYYLFISSDKVKWFCQCLCVITSNLHSSGTGANSSTVTKDRETKQRKVLRGSFVLCLFRFKFSHFNNCMNNMNVSLIISLFYYSHFQKNIYARYKKIFVNTSPSNNHRTESIKGRLALMEITVFPRQLALI